MEQKGIIHVYFDFTNNGVKAGRVVIELDRALAPMAVENFRCLCTGEKGLGEQKMPLHFKGSPIHKFIPLCMAQGGDIIRGDGSGGDTIYGMYFAHETNHLLHDEAGLVGLVCDKKTQKPSSQFYITLASCPQLDGENTIIGKVVKGLNTIQELADYPRVNDVPQVNFVIANCGEFKPAEPWKVEEDDGTPDVYPPWPDDWDVELHNEMFVDIARNINQSGNMFFHNKNYVDAERKYAKVIRYIDWRLNKGSKEILPTDLFLDIKYKAFLNMAAARLKCDKNADAIQICNEVIKVKPNNAKAFYRRALGKLAMKEYDEAMADLKLAYKLNPNDRIIRNTFEIAKKKKQCYLEKEKIFFEKIFTS